MPQVFKVGGYLVYFWSNEGIPTEPIHVHVTNGVPSVNDTKIWLTQNGKCLLCHNHSDIPNRKLRVILDIIESRHEEVVKQWLGLHGSVSYYC